MVRRFETPEAAMRRAIELAQRGRGHVEPNPPVGAVVVDEQGNCLGEGWHQQFGGPHAEVHALDDAGDAARGQTLYVTLEPCCHTGKTPPCTDAILRAGIRRVVVALSDPAPHVAGQGLNRLQAAGIEIQVGLCAVEAWAVTGPFATGHLKQRPWVIAKWAMTLDGRIASHTGDSQWISHAESRQRVHALRGRMDAILVGAGTAGADDPLLTARPPGPRTPVRTVVDSHARLSLSSKLVQTASQFPVICACGPQAPANRITALQAEGVEVLQLCGSDTSSHRPDLRALLKELHRREITNLLVEGGGQLLGSLFDQRLIDEVHVFVAPRLVGGQAAIAPLAGTGFPMINDGPALLLPSVEVIEHDAYIHGLLSEPPDVV